MCLPLHKSGCTSDDQCFSSLKSWIIHFNAYPPRLSPLQEIKEIVTFSRQSSKFCWLKFLPLSLSLSLSLSSDLPANESQQVGSYMASVSVCALTSLCFVVPTMQYTTEDFRSGQSGDEAGYRWHRNVDPPHSEPRATRCHGLITTVVVNVKWLVHRLIKRWIEVCFQPGYNS